MINLFDLERAARERLPSPSWDYIAGGVEDERSLVENREAFQRLKLRPRILTGVGDPDLTTHVLGQELAFPVLLAPTTPQRLAHPEAERATARAATAEGTIAVIGTESQFGLSEITAQASGPLWFQLYCYHDREVTCRLIHKAEAAGFRAIVITVDLVRGGRRERNLRNRFSFPPEIEMPVLLGVGLDDARIADSATRHAYLESLSLLSLTWKDLNWIRDSTSLPIILKGVMCAEDARLAVDHGVDAIIVSNHGGRQLDVSPATIEVLPEVVEAVGGRIEILMDSGIRRGTDVLKALACGAAATLIGRPALWGLAVDGESGVRLVLQLLRGEISNAMTQLGVASIDEIGPQMIADVGRFRTR